MIILLRTSTPLAAVPPSVDFPPLAQPPSRGQVPPRSLGTRVPQDAPKTPKDALKTDHRMMPPKRLRAPRAPPPPPREPAS